MSVNENEKPKVQPPDPQVDQYMANLTGQIAGDAYAALRMAGIPTQGVVVTVIYDRTDGRGLDASTMAAFDVARGNPANMMRWSELGSRRAAEKLEIGVVMTPSRAKPGEG